MNTKKIGLFDSGMGGLSILQALIKQFPNKDFVYFGDILNLPYGEKSKEELSQCCIKVKDFLLSSGADTLVIACNAASCLYLDQTYYKNVLLINVISPTVKKLIEVSSENDKVGVLATSFTVNSNVYPTAIQPLNPKLQVFQESAPELAPLVERGFAHHPKCKETLKRHLEPLLKQEIDILVLGCTHYFFLKDEIKKLLPSHVKIVDPLDCLILPDEEDIKEEKTSSKVEMYLSQEQPEFIKSAHQIVKDPQITVLKSF
ncbi:MAG: glutamate racemase [Bdellovibrionales bacterium]|nr:glutamate racemase [Bdellovibrionales bacterium]